MNWNVFYFPLTLSLLLFILVRMSREQNFTTTSTKQNGSNYRTLRFILKETLPFTNEDVCSPDFLFFMELFNIKVQIFKKKFVVCICCVEIHVWNHFSQHQGYVSCCNYVSPCPVSSRGQWYLPRRAEQPPSQVHTPLLLSPCWATPARANSCFQSTIVNVQKQKKHLTAALFAAALDWDNAPVASWWAFPMQ